MSDRAAGATENDVIDRLPWQLSVTAGQLQTTMPDDHN